MTLAHLLETVPGHFRLFDPGDRYNNDDYHADLLHRLGTRLLRSAAYIGALHGDQ